MTIRNRKMHTYLKLQRIESSKIALCPWNKSKKQGYISENDDNYSFSNKLFKTENPF